MTRLLAITLPLFLSAACASDGSDPTGPGGGKTDDIGDGTEGDDGTDAFFYRGEAGVAISDPGCMNCDAVGFGRSTMKINAPLSGHVYYRATIRHPNPYELSAGLTYNSNHSLDDYQELYSWYQDLSGEREDSDALVHAIRKLEDTEGCETTAEFPDCYEITVTGDLGMHDIIGMDPTPGEVAKAVWDLDILDLGLNGATGTIMESHLILEGPLFFM